MLLVDDDRPEPTPSGVRELSLFLTPDPGAEAREVEAAIEGMLLLLEEFCNLTDMIRSDTLQILAENIPLLKAKVTEMRGFYAKVDRLEASVRTVGHHTAFLEAHVLQAKQDHGAFPQPPAPGTSVPGLRPLPSDRARFLVQRWTVAALGKLVPETSSSIRAAHAVPD